MAESRRAITIPVHPWFHDHHFAGKIILAGVETMLLLATEVLERCPFAQIKNIEDIHFSRFLEIPKDASVIEALVECESRSDGSEIHTRLLSRVKFKKMSRIIEHASMTFKEGVELERVEVNSQSVQNTRISASAIYHDMVPFGPAYQTLKDSLMLDKFSASGILQAPDIGPFHPAQKILGSPFPLDGAMHAACVLGQQVVDYIPFPVGIERRMVLRPTQPDHTYFTKAHLVSQSEGELQFNLTIFNDEGEVYEVVLGLTMRDVSGGVL
jgi:hypothetical protein